MADCRPQKLVPLTAVCQRWRHVLLETPLLWSVIDDDGGSRSEPSFTHYIQRCPRGPLSVKLYQWPRDCTLDFLACQSKRVRDLSVTGGYSENQHDFVDFISAFQADELQRCRLGLHHDEEYTGPPSRSFFQGCAPQLRALRLEFLPYLPRNRFPALAHLILQCPHEVTFSFRDLIAFLSGCRGLQSLYLYGMATSGIGAPSFSGAPSSLLAFPRLRKFSVVDVVRKSYNIDLDFPPSAVEVAQFEANRSAIQHAMISSMNIPPECLVYLTPVLSSDLKSYADQMDALIKPTFMRIVDAKQSFVNPRLSERISLVVVQSPESRGVRFDIQFDNYNHLQSIKQNLRHALASSSLFANVCDLWSDTGAVPFLRQPDSILWCFPRLKRLQICSCAQEDRGLNAVFEALSAVDGDSGSIICPQLDAVSAYIAKERLVMQTRDLVQRRATLGHPLKHLHLRVELDEASDKVLEAMREMAGLVEDFGVSRVEGDQTTVDPWGAPTNDWTDSYGWNGRVPQECREAEEIDELWPVWEQRVDPGDQ